MSNPAISSPIHSPVLTTSGSRRSPAWVLPVLIGVSGVLTALTGLVVGWFTVWFQVFGSANGEDYQVAAGAYVATSLVLVLGALAGNATAVPRWLTLGSAVGAAVHLFLALASVSEAAAATDPGPGSTGWQDGATTVLACPWTWPLLVLGVAGVVRRSRVSG